MYDNFLEKGERTCPVCGKTFWAGEKWAFKKGYAHEPRIYCSWGCMRSEEKETLTSKIRKAIRDGLTDPEIKKALGVSQQQIDFAYRDEAKRGRWPTEGSGR